MNLYTMTQQDRELYELLSGDDEIPQDQLCEILQASEDAIHLKAARVVAVIKTLQADADAHKAIADHHAKKAAQASRQGDRLRDYLLMCMELVGVDKVGTLEHCAKIPKPRASLIVHDGAVIPAQYVTVKQVESVDKTALKADILSGAVTVDGAEIVYKKTLKVE
jgi:hypothetical protein